MVKKLDFLLNPLAIITSIFLCVLSFFIMQFLLNQPGSGIMNIHISRTYVNPQAKCYSFLIHKSGNFDIYPRNTPELTCESELYEFCKTNRKSIIALNICADVDATTQDVITAMDHIEAINNKLRSESCFHTDDLPPYTRLIFTH
jgi:biopolymer transport protein ExbD